jgi:two-component sensor histidine kinase/DNA-binding response OmpR family regulator
MTEQEKVNILLVDDQPGKLMSYEVILKDLGQNLIKATSAREAFTHLLKNEIAIVLIDVVMPEMDGFELAAMIREHPRFRETAIIFISAVQLSDQDRMRGYEMGAVDYVSVPVIPEVLRAKVRVFSELYRKTRQLEALNHELETRVKDRTQALEGANARLVESERRRGFVLSAGKMGSWMWDIVEGTISLDPSQYEIFGLEPGPAVVPAAEGERGIRGMVDENDLPAMRAAFDHLSQEGGTHQAEVRIHRPDGETRWCLVSATADRDGDGQVARIAGVTLDITERKRAEQTQLLLAKEVDHRARNALAVVQAVLRMTHARNLNEYVAAVEGRISALARAHGLLSASRWQGADLARLINDELAPYKTAGERRLSIAGPVLVLAPSMAQALAIVLHELATNAAKYGALSQPAGLLTVGWTKQDGVMTLNWVETGLTDVKAPTSRGFGTTVIKASVQEQLRGKLTLDWRREGLRCAIEVPDEGEAVTNAERTRDVAPSRLVDRSSGARVLLVEDEALVGLMMRAALTDAGYQVTGPFSSVSEALIAIKSARPDCAVLDINLLDGPVYPLATALTDAGVPFVFATGYDVRSVDERFKHVTVLQKPADRASLLANLPPPNAAMVPAGTLRVTA